MITTIRPFPIHPFPQTIDLDDDGYPTDDWIAAMSQANDALSAARWMRDKFPEFVWAIGNTFEPNVYQGKDDFDHDILVIRYSTGGWSGQEEFINAVESGPCGWLYLWSWRRGGHYEFRIPMHDLERKEEGEGA